jgi:hypothetical protein
MVVLDDITEVVAVEEEDITDVAVVVEKNT